MGEGRERSGGAGRPYACSVLAICPWGHEQGQPRGGHLRHDQFRRIRVGGGGRRCWRCRGRGGGHVCASGPGSQCLTDERRRGGSNSQHPDDALAGATTASAVLAAVWRWCRRGVGVGWSGTALSCGDRGGVSSLGLPSQVDTRIRHTHAHASRTGTRAHTRTHAKSEWGAGRASERVRKRVRVRTRQRRTFS